MPSETAPAVAMAKDQAVVDTGVANTGQSARSDESMLQFSTIARNQTALDGLLDEIVVVGFDARAARADGPVRVGHRDRNKDALDKLIAVHAVALGVTLFTSNEADFHTYPGLTL